MHATNDLIEVQSKRLAFIVEEKSNKGQQQTKKISGGGNNLIQIAKIIPKDGWYPLPRRDHTSVFFKAQ